MLGSERFDEVFVVDVEDCAFAIDRTTGNRNAVLQPPLAPCYLADREVHIPSLRLLLKGDSVGLEICVQVCRREHNDISTQGLHSCILYNISLARSSHVPYRSYSFCVMVSIKATDPSQSPSASLGESSCSSISCSISIDRWHMGHFVIHAAQSSSKHVQWKKCKQGRPTIRSPSTTSSKQITLCAGVSALATFDAK